MSDDSCCPLIELRQYTLQPGQRDVLIDLFDREFVETQEATGMCLVGQFRDVERPDRFVWIRGFPDMPARATSLQAFYGGPVWAAHREAANATMIDSDDVLLLRPATAKSAFARNDSARVPVDASERPASRIVATIFHFTTPVDAAFARFFEAEIEPALSAAGAQPLAQFVTESSENTFPRLPVRTGENVFVSFARFADEAALAAFDARLASSPRWNEQLQPALAGRLKAAPERLVLTPTARSRLR